MATYLFYDVETTGLNVAFDQVLQFAATRTDEDFNVIEEHDLRVRLRPDMIPSPEAVVTHRIPMPTMRDEGVSEAEAIRQIHALLNEPGTISLGYNSLSFDDEVLRFSFYRNLLPPYTHQYANDCGRMDVYPMAVMYWLAGSDAVQWSDAEGAFKLETLAASNGFDAHAEHRDHDAASDVRVTLELARALAQETERWADLADFFQKDGDEARINALPTFDIGGPSYPVGLVIGGAFGASKAFQRPVIGLGTHRHYTNQSRWLALDTPKLPGVASRPIRPNTEVVRKKLGVPNFVVPSSKNEYAQLDERRRTIVQKNLSWLREHPVLFQQIAGYYLESTYEKVPNLDPDAALYQQGFFSDEQKARFAEFHQLESAQEQARFVRRFDAPHIRALALRHIIRNQPEAAWPKAVASYAKSYLRHVDPHTAADVLIDHKGNPRRTPHAALEAIDRLRAEGHHETPLDAEQQSLLDDLEAHLKATFDVHASYTFA